MKTTKLLLALLALTTGLLAQDNNPAKLALAREVISAMQADKMFDGMATQMKQMAAQMATPPPGATPEQIKILENYQGKVMDLTMTEAKAMVAKMDQVYADVYTEAELKGIRNFYVSPEGQAMVAKQPQLMQHLMPLMQEMQRGLMPKMQQLTEEMKTALMATKKSEAPAAK